MFVTEKERQTPVVVEVDVAVVGGGTAGAIAAIAAARTGASVALVEQYGTLGGAPTVGRVVHLSNTFVDSEWKQVIAGIPQEIMEKVAELGSLHGRSFQESLIGTNDYHRFVHVDPEIVAMVLNETAEEEGIRCLLHTSYCDAIVEGDRVAGIIVQNRAGRQAIMAKVVVDASGEGYVAADAGIPCITDIENPALHPSAGLVMRLANCDQEAYMSYVLDTKTHELAPNFMDWLSNNLGMDKEEILANRRLQWFFRTDSGSFDFLEDLERRRKLWENDGYFAYIRMSYLRKLLRKAAENGDFELGRQVKGIGRMIFNFDGGSGSKKRPGEVILNFVSIPLSYDQFIENPGTIEIAARRRAREVYHFFKKYVPGFDQSYIVDTAYETQSRHLRVFEAVYMFSLEDTVTGNTFEDSVFLSASEQREMASHEVPYRMLVPKRIENLLVAGKCASGSRWVRPIPTIMALGHAAGTAAALAAKGNVKVQDVDIALLQKILEQQKAIIHYADRRAIR